MADTDRIKRNLQKMAAANAPEADMDGYLASEGFNSAADWRAALAPKVVAQGRSDAAANALGQGATFNLGDEIAAGVRAALPDFSNWMMKGPAWKQVGGGEPTPQTVSTAPDFQGRYDEELAKARAQTKADSAAYPVMTTGANIAGNVATTALALPAAATSLGPSLVGNTIKLGATGAALGGAAGFGEGEGGFENRLGAAILPAAVGGALGAALPTAGAIGRSVVESAPGRWVGREVVAPTMRQLGLGGAPRSLSAAAPDGGAGSGGMLAPFVDSAANTAESGMIQRLATALQRSKLDPARVEGRLTQLGDGAMLADVDPQFLSMARTVNTLPGETRSFAKNVLEGRDRQAGNRLVSAFEGGENPPSSFALRGEGQAFDQNARAVGRQVYQGDMVDAGLNQTPRLRQMLDQPEVDAAIKRVTESISKARAGRPDAPAPSSIEVMHMVKQEIAKLGEDAATGRPLSTQQVWRDLANDFVNALKDANPALRAADKAYAEAKSLPEFFDTGRSFLGKGSSDKATANSAPALADMLANANVQQQAATRAGTTNAARETALEGTGPARALARRIDQSTPVQAKLAEIYGPGRARDIANRASAESTFADTSNDILRGSKTADKLLEVVDDANNISLRGGTGGLSARVIENLGALAQKLMGPNEAVRNQIGRAMLNPDTAESRRVLALAAELVRKRASGTPIRAGLIEGAASQAGGQ